MPPVKDQVEEVNRQVAGETNTAMNAVANTPAPTITPPPPPSSTVSTDDLQGPTAPIDPPAPSFPSLSGITAAATNRLQTTQSELQAEQGQNTALTSRITSLQNDLLGEADVQAQLEEEAKLNDRRARLREISSNISTGLTELQTFDAETENMLEQFRGQGTGVAANIIDRKNTERRRLRNLDKLTQGANLARQVSAASLLQGEIETAQAEVDRAVELEFAPVRQQIEQAKWLLERSDAGLERLTDAERAEYTQFIAANEAMIADKKETEQQVLGIADEAIRNGASQQEVNAILKSETPQEAQSIASPYIGLIDRQQAQASISASRASTAASNARRALDEYELQVAQDKVQEAEERAASGQWSPEQAEAATEYTTQLRGEPSYKEMFEVRAGYNTASVGASQNDGFGDIAMVNGYQRMIDPGATVRGEDIKTQAEAVSFIQQALNIRGQVLKGDRFTPEVRQKLLGAIDGQYERRVDEFNENTRARYENALERDPTTAGAVTFDDIGDTFSKPSDVDEETVDPEGMNIGETFIIDGMTYTKVGPDDYEPTQQSSI